MVKIYLFRHGETDWNKDKSLKYSKELRDAKLNETGIAQAKQNAIDLKDKGIQYVYTSNFKRANETGKILAKFLGVDYEVVEELQELSLYDETVVGLTKQEIKEKIGIEDYKLLINSKDELLDWRPLNCETKREVRERMVKAINGICKNTPYNIIGIASHGAIIRELLKVYDFDDYSKVKNCEVIELEYVNSGLKILRRIKND